MKQSSEGNQCQSNCSQMFFKIGVEKFPNIYRKKPVLESLFNKVAILQAWGQVKKKSKKGATDQ